MIRAEKLLPATELHFQALFRKFVQLNWIIWKIFYGNFAALIVESEKHLA